MPEDKCLVTDFLLRSTRLSTDPASFPIISIVKLARKQVLIEFSIRVERYWRPSTKTLGTYSQDAAGKLKLALN